MIEKAHAETKAHFQALGFNIHMHKACGKGGHECFLNMDTGICVEIAFDKPEATLSLVDKMVMCRLGPFSYPNSLIPKFITNIERHRFND